MALAHRADTVTRSKSKGHIEIHRSNNSGGLITCFVTQPDNVVLHIDVDSKANGQEVLNKVVYISIIFKHLLRYVPYLEFKVKQTILVCNLLFQRVILSGLI